MTERDRLSIVSFGSDVVVHLAGIAVTDAGRDAARREIGTLATRGMTNLSAGWFEGATCAARAADGDPTLTARVILLSDGGANEGITDHVRLGEHARELRARGVVTSTLGIGDGYNETLLHAIAEHGGGRMHDAEHAEEIATILLGEVGEAANLAVEHAEVEVTLPSDVRATVLGTVSASVRPGSATVQLGGIARGGVRTVVVRLTLPNGDRGRELPFRMTARAVDGGPGATALSVEAVATITLTNGEASKAQRRNVEASVAAAHACYAHLLRQTATLNQDGAYLEARRLVDVEVPHFERFVRDLPGGEALLARVRVLGNAADREWSSRTRKETMLAAKMMLHGGPDIRAARKSWDARLVDNE